METKTMPVPSKEQFDVAFRTLQSSDAWNNAVQDAQKGSGVGMFRFDISSDKTNVKYFFFPQGGPSWNFVASSSPDWTELLAKYQPGKNFLIGIHLPIQGRKEEWIGKIFLFSFENPTTPL